ncbi:MAG: hypothetical protein AAFO83_10950 [Cyanobacteria bacterium J06607_13]
MHGYCGVTLDGGIVVRIVAIQRLIAYSSYHIAALAEKCIRNAL